MVSCCQREGLIRVTEKRKKKRSDRRQESSQRKTCPGDYKLEMPVRLIGGLRTPWSCCENVIGRAAVLLRQPNGPLCGEDEDEDGDEECATLHSIPWCLVRLGRTDGRTCTGSVCIAVLPSALSHVSTE